MVLCGVLTDAARRIPVTLIYLDDFTGAAFICGSWGRFYDFGLKRDSHITLLALWLSNQG